MIGIIDYGMGNLGSVSNACAFLGLNSRILTRAGEMDDCRALILPGVGAFGDCMQHLNEHGFTGPIRNWIEADRPLLGICLGLQVLLEGSDESPDVPGFGILPGRVRRFESDPSCKVPQIGWNQVRQTGVGSSFFEAVPDQSYFYFVHSFYVDTPATEVVAGVTTYSIEYTSAISRGNLTAVQFHPEKSQSRGLQLLRNFSAMYESGATPGVGPACSDGPGAPIR